MPLPQVRPKVMQPQDKQVNVLKIDYVIAIEIAEHDNGRMASRALVRLGNRLG